MANISLSELRSEYQRLWDSCKILPSWEDRINQVVDAIAHNRSRYEAVASLAGKCPWYFIGVIHSMEASLDFSCHLHNGDSLLRRTVQVPIGRPLGSPSRGWDVGYTWEESAVDALKLEEIDRVRDWSIPGLLFQCEKYNGWGYRQYHSEVLSPYLWSGTNHYSSGKYAADGRFDDSLVSQQAGVVPLLKKLIFLPSESFPPSATSVKPLLKGGACKLRTEVDTWFTQAEKLEATARLHVRAKTVLPVLAWRESESQSGYLVVTFATMLRDRNTWHVRADEVRMALVTPVIQQASPRAAVAGDLSALPGGKAIKYMKNLNFRVRALNIVYLVGASADDWSPVPNAMDKWNDVRCIIRNTGEVLGSWKATTDPGRYYEQNPLNDAGCAILALGQHRDGWEIGLHRGFPALTQCGDIVIYRDRSGDGMRTGHTVIAGPECRINHHGCNGRDGDPNSIGRWSAGCCVGLYWKSHLQYIDFCKNSGNQTFDVTLIDGASFAKLP